jgi:alkylhydroperoxidase family enzyme
VLLLLDYRRTCSSAWPARCDVVDNYSPRDLRVDLVLTNTGAARACLRRGRLDPISDGGQAAPDAMRAVQRVEAYIQQCGLEKSLIELVKMRASQINGCTYCLHVHARMPGHDREPDDVGLVFGNEPLDGLSDPVLNEQ